ncbi:restriction endonuclease subunit S [Olleya namhaensis]|uniref:restriction endonuclease subunit S n=1 Tax=Olleya namhaensis TaxID=1144750 RepID=UPI00232EBF4E|nr:restriction endonuclease subunit S [Olleya namhaensis]
MAAQKETSLRGTKQSHDATANNKQIATKSVITSQPSLRGGTTKQSASLKPKLRFKEFEGEWENEEFGTLVNRSKSKYNPAKENMSLPCIELECLSQETGILLKTFDSIEQKSIKNRFIEGEILFGKLRPYLKKYLKAPFEGVCSSEIWVLKGIKLDNEYLYHLLQTHKFNLEVNITSGSKMPRAEWEYISNVKFKFPKRPEQQKIANFLTAVDTKLQQLTTKKETLEQYKKGVMQQLFSQQLRFKPDVIARTQDDAISPNETEFPDWEEKKLGEVCDVNPKNSQLPTSFVYIDLESVEKGILIKENEIDLEEAPSRAQRMLEVNDILFQTVRPYQMNNLYFNKTGDYVASTGYAQLRTKESSMFLYQLLHTHHFVNKVLERCTGTSYPAINSNDLAKIKFKFPSLKEQKKIANYLSAIDLKIEAVQTQITKTQAFKKGLLQAMFV